MRLLRILMTAALAGALVLSGCSKDPGSASPNPNQQGKPQAKQRLELVPPMEGALVGLKEMNEAGKQKDIPGAKAKFDLFRNNWGQIKPELDKVDPKLAKHIEDGAVELDLEFGKPADQFRFYELSEETVKIGRLLSQAAELLNVPIKPELVVKDPTLEIPFNSEQRIEVTLVDHKIQPDVIEVAQHTKVTFVVTNKGKEEHEFVLDHYAVEAEVKPGETAELTLVLLDAGEFETACHIPGHYEVGMFGTLRVTPAELKKK